MLKIINLAIIWAVGLSVKEAGTSAKELKSNSNHLYGVCTDPRLSSRVVQLSRTDDGKGKTWGLFYAAVKIENEEEFRGAQVGIRSPQFDKDSPPDEHHVIYGSAFKPWDNVPVDLNGNISLLRIEVDNASRLAVAESIGVQVG